MKRFVLVAFALLALMASVSAQEKKQEPAKPALKPEVSLELRTLQVDAYKLALQIKNLEQQYQQIQKQLDAKGQELNQKGLTALERSGLDKEKFELNTDTLEVTAKPVVAKNEVPKR